MPMTCAAAREAEPIRPQQSSHRTPVGEAAGDGAVAQGHGPPVRILLAEDNPASRELAVVLLEQAGYHVDCAANGLEVMQQLAERDYALVLMDVQMPLQDGLQTARLIRQGGPRRDVPIVAITAHALDGDRERCLAAGMDDYIAKAAGRDDLERIVEKWAGRRRGASVAPGRAPQQGLSDAVDTWPPRELLGRFIVAAEEHIGRMGDAARKRDEMAVRAEAHALEGAAAIARTTRLQRGARLVGHSARSGDWGQVVAGISRLQAECEVLRGLKQGHAQFAAG